MKLRKFLNDLLSKESVEETLKDAQDGSKVMVGAGLITPAIQESLHVINFASLRQFMC